MGEVKEWEKVVKERATQVYARIVDCLKELGVKVEILKDLEQQLKKLENTLREYTKAVEDCGQALDEGEYYLQNCKNQLREFNESFGEVFEGMEKVLRGLEGNVEQRFSAGARGALAGSIVGGLVGVGAFAEAGAAAETVALYTIFWNNSRSRCRGSNRWFIRCCIKCKKK